MTDRPLRPNDAARALADIRAQQLRTAGADELPRWYWAAVGTLIVLLTAGVESRRPVIVVAASVAFAAGLTAVVWRVLADAPVQVRGDLLGAKGGFAIAGFVVGLVVVTLVVAFTLTAAGVPFPGTIADCVTFAGLVVGGPMLTRYLRRVRMANAERAIGG
jgi:hypothetical protein